MRRLPGASALLAVMLLLAARGAAAQVAPDQPDATVLQPGDVLKLTIWGEKDLSGEFLINELGVVTVPVVGDMRVAGMRPGMARDTVVARLRREINNRAIEVIPLRRVFILGEVNEPGLYNVDLTLPLAGVVAVAGGVTPAGDPGKIRIVRQGKVYQSRIDTATALAAGGILSNDQIIVEPRSWFARNTLFVVSTLLSLTSIITTVIVASN